MAAPAFQKQTTLKKTGWSEHRYEDLLQQIVQLNADLEKTAAYSQTMQEERDETLKLNGQLKEEVTKVHERCEKLQLILMQQTEQKIETDKQHEELIAKWKKQLHAKTKAFTELQKKLAPPRDLEQLRLQIQDEVEEPHQRKVAALQEQVERHRQEAFSMRREYELLKTSYEQMTVNQTHELSSLQNSYEAKVDALKGQVNNLSEELDSVYDEDVVKKLRSEKQSMKIEQEILRKEVQSIRAEMKGVLEDTAKEKHRQEMEWNDLSALNAKLELDVKELQRSLTKAQQECQKLQAAYTKCQSNFDLLSNELEETKDQLRLKEKEVEDTTRSHDSRLQKEIEEREEEKATFQEKEDKLRYSLQQSEELAEAYRQKLSKASSEDYEDQSVARLQQKEDQIRKLQGQINVQENEIRKNDHEFKERREKLESEICQLSTDKSGLLSELETTKEEAQTWKAKFNTASASLTKTKGELQTLKTRLQHVQAEWSQLQIQHKSSLEDYESIKAQLQDSQAQVSSLESEYAELQERVENERDEYNIMVADLRHKLSSREGSYRSQVKRLKKDTTEALTKALKQLTKAQKKAEAYKRKCVEVHGQLKTLSNEHVDGEATVAELQRQHTAEVESLLQQLGDLETDKTELLQKRWQQ